MSDPTSPTDTNETVPLGTEADTDANLAATSSEAVEGDAKPEAPERSLQDIVQDVLKKPEVPDASSTAEAANQEKPAVEGDKPEEGKPAEQSDADLPFHNHPRWKSLIQERNELKEPAENFKAISEYMEATGLTPAEVSEGFEIMGLLKSREEASLQKVLTWFEERTGALRKMLGSELDGDLKAKVDEGFVDPEIAKELSRRRAVEELGRLSAQDDEKQRQEKEARDQKERYDTVVAWEGRIAAQDPDYLQKKAHLVTLQARTIMEKEGRHPATSSEAIVLLDRAYKEVSDLLRSALPKPTPLVPPPLGHSQRTETAPKTLQEAVQAALR